MNATIEQRHVVAEFSNDGGIMVMFHDGEIRWFATAPEVVRVVRRQDRKATKTVGGVIITLDWLNTPAGFEPPQ